MTSRHKSGHREVVKIGGRQSQGCHLFGASVLGKDVTLVKNENFRNPERVRLDSDCPYNHRRLTEGTFVKWEYLTKPYKGDTIVKWEYPTPSSTHPLQRRADRTTPSGWHNCKKGTPPTPSTRFYRSPPRKLSGGNL